MAGRLFILAKLAMKERLAINLLRGHYPADLGTGHRTAFDRLRDLALDAGLTICAAENPCAGQDEIRLLAWFAVLQRRRPLLNIDFDADLLDHMRECAARLGQLNLRLDYMAATRIHGIAGQASVPIEQLPDQRRAAFMPSTLQGRVLRLVSERGSVSTGELTELGISRQVITRMVNHGLLHRVRMGRYAARRSPAA